MLDLSRFDRIDAEIGRPFDRRRCKRLALSFENLADLLRGRIAIEGQPADLRVMGISAWAPCFETIDVIVNSAEFPPLLEGMELERVQVVVIRVIKCDAAEVSVATPAANQTQPMLPR